MLFHPKNYLRIYNSPRAHLRIQQCLHIANYHALCINIQRRRTPFQPVHQQVSDADISD